MLDERAHSELTGATMSLYSPKEVWEYIRDHNPAIWPLVAELFKGLTVQWKKL